MAGKAYQMINTIIEQRAKGNSVAAAGIRVRMLLRGIDPEKYGPGTEDDPAIIMQLEQMMAESDGIGASA